MNNNVVKSLLLVTVCGFSTVSHAELNISPIMGVTDWGDDTFSIQGNSIVIDSKNALTRGVELGHTFDGGLRLGGQIVYQEADVLSNSNGSNTGYVKMAQFNATVSYFIPAGEYVRPYIGFGMGTSRVEFRGGTEATLDGDSYLAKVGMEVKMTERMYWLIGAQSSYFKVRDDNNRMETNLNQVFVGVNFETGH